MSKKSSDKNAGETQFLSAKVISSDLKYPNEPQYFTSRDIDPFFTWASEQGASDITIQTGESIVLEVFGKLYRVTNRKMTPPEVLDIVANLYKNEGIKATLSGSSDADFAYQIRPSRDKMFRFRVNAVPIIVSGSRGIEITCRSIPDIPPPLEDIGLEPELIEAMAPKVGMVIITGGTGSGKSTLLASFIRYLLEQTDGHRKFVTYESPVEYVYDKVNKPSSIIAQTEIASCLPTFSAGTRNALRRKPAVILVGEARDAETIGEAVTASMTGHLLFSTVHSNGFVDTIRRMVNVFSEHEKNGRAVDIISSLKVVVSQRLVPSTDGRRVALREYVIMSEEIVDILLQNGVENLTRSCREVLKKYGRSFAQDAKTKYEEGRISHRTYKESLWGLKADEFDAKDEMRREALRKSGEDEALNKLRGQKKLLDIDIQGESDPLLKELERPVISFDDIGDDDAEDSKY